jgi:hypothetical protein
MPFPASSPSTKEPDRAIESVAGEGPKIEGDNNL